MKPFSKLSTATLTAALAASCAVAPAAAEPGSGYCFDHPEDQSAICDAVRSAPTPTTTPKSGVDGAVDFLGHGVVTVFVVLVAVLVIGGILAHVFGTSDADAQERGRQIASDHYAQQVHAAQAAWNPDPADYDPLGIGVAPPPAPEVKPPPPPNLTPEDAQRLGVFGRPVDLVPGSANAVLIARDGSWKAAETAWNEACRAANLGRHEDRASRVPGVDRTRRVFVPAAELVRVEPLDSGDAVLVVRTLDLSVGADHLAAVTPFLLRTARVRLASSWVRAFSSDEFKITLSTRTDEEIQRAAEPAPAAASDDEDPWA